MEFVNRLDGTRSGIADAGRIWHARFFEWLIDVMGFVQSIVERCIFYRVLDGGRDVLILRAHVDDGRAYYSLAVPMASFRDKFVTEFGPSPDLPRECAGLPGAVVLLP